VLALWRAIHNHDRAIERAADLESKATIQADCTEVALPDVKIRKPPILDNPVANGADQSGAISSPAITWVRADGAHFFIAWDRGASARHGNQTTLFANAAITTQVDSAVAERAGFGPRLTKVSSTGQMQEVPAMTAQVATVDIVREPNREPVARPAAMMMKPIFSVRK